MELEIFTLADHAQDAAGKLFISGTFDTVHCKGFPFVLPAACLVLRLRFSAKETGAHEIILRSTDPNGKQLLEPARVQLEVPQPAPGADYSAINLPINIHQLKLDAPGMYSFELFINDDWKSGIRLYARSAA